MWQTTPRHLKCYRKFQFFFTFFTSLINVLENGYECLHVGLSYTVFSLLTVNFNILRTIDCEANLVELFIA